MTENLHRLRAKFNINLVFLKAPKFSLSPLGDKLTRSISLEDKHGETSLQHNKQPWHSVFILNITLFILLLFSFYSIYFFFIPKLSRECEWIFYTRRTRWLTARTWRSYLRFGQHEGGGHLEAFGSGQVLVDFELVLQLQQLLAGESRSGPPALPQQSGLGARWRKGEEGRASQKKEKESHFQARQLVCYLILVNKSSFKSSWVQFLCLIENAWMCFAERSKINQRSRTVTATAVFFLSSQGRRKCDVILWVGQAHIWPHSAAIINYNSFTPVYCWRGGQGRSGRGGP